jgi:hypothetical protein
MVSLKKEYGKPEMAHDTYCPSLYLEGEQAAALGLDKVTVGKEVTLTIKAMVASHRAEVGDGICVSLDLHEAEVVKVGASAIKALYGEDD